MAGPDGVRSVMFPDLLRLRRSFRRTVILPVTVLVGGMIIMVMLMVVWIAQRQNADSHARERALAESAIAERRSLLEKTADDYANWDESFDAASRDDWAWIDANIARPVAEKYGFDIVAVTDDGGHVLFGARGEMRFTGPMNDVLRGGYDELASGLRTGETVSGVLMLNINPALVAVSRMRPFGRAAGPPEPGSGRQLVFVDVFSAKQLSQLSHAYALTELRIAPADAGDSSIPLQTPDGTRSYLVWQNPDPGTDMLRDLLPVLLVLFSAFVMLTLFVLRQARDAALRLRESEDRAMRDPLTGLPNRAMLNAQVQMLLDGEDGPAFAIACIDLDGFKQVNDEFGHDIGDEVLRQTARRIASVLREGDMLARFGGDEFVVTFPDLVEPLLLRQITERIIRAVKDPMVAGGGTFRIGATIGVAIHPGDAGTLADLLKAADTALYRAKRDTKGTVQFYALHGLAGQHAVTQPGVDQGGVG